MKTCSIDGCNTLARTKGMCQKHYKQLWRNGDQHARRATDRKGPCSVDGCERDIYAKRLCTMHYQRKRMTGEVGSAEKRSGKEGWITDKGYRAFKIGGRTVLEHRLVMEEHLGRRLLPEETVHHLYGDRLDNRIERLELWSSSHPSGQRVSDKVEWAKELLALYEPQALAEDRTV